VHHVRIFRKHCSSCKKSSKGCSHDSSNTGVLKLIVKYPWEIFKDPTNYTVLAAIGPAERNLVQIGFTILLVTAVWLTFIFCTIFCNFYVTLSDDNDEVKDILVLGFTVIMTPWGLLLRRVGWVNDSLEFKPELNSPKVFKRYQSCEAFVKAFNSQRTSQKNMISLSELSFIVTERKWYHRLPRCIISCFSGSTLEEMSNKILVEHFTKIMEKVSLSPNSAEHEELEMAWLQGKEAASDTIDISSTSDALEVDSPAFKVEAAESPPAEESSFENISASQPRESTQNKLELEAAKFCDEPAGMTFEELHGKTENEEERGSKASSSKESAMKWPIWSSTCHLLQVYESQELVEILKDDLLYNGGYDKNLGSKTTLFYFGMFYRTLYYSLFANIDDMMVVVGFEVINFFSSFVLYFLRMSYMYFRQSARFVKWLESQGAPDWSHKVNEDKWKAELSVTWVLERFTEILCLADFVISTTVLRYRYRKDDFVPLRDMGENEIGYISHERYVVLMRFVLVILSFEVFHFVTMLLLFKRFYNLKLRTYLHFLTKSKYYRFIIFFGGLHVLQDMYLLRHKLELSKF
jgi:hypothetical protein